MPGISRIIEEKRIVLDGGDFVDVAFSRCVLVYSGGPWTFQNTVFHDCQMDWQGPAAAAMELQRLMLAAQYANGHRKLSISPEGKLTVDPKDE